MSPERSEQIAELIRSLASCQQTAARLGLDFLVDLLAAALVEAALSWDGGGEVLADPGLRLDALVRMKLRIALAKAGTNVVAAPTR